MNYQDDLRKLEELSRQVKKKKTLDDGMDFWGYMGDLDVQVAYDYQPFEPQTRNYPGCNAAATVTSVMWNGIELIDGLNRDTSHVIPDVRNAPSYLEDLEDQCQEDWLAKNEER